MNDRRSENRGPHPQAPDALAGLIRGAGRLPEPGAAFRDSLRDELAGEWQRLLAARRRRRWRMGAGLAAALALAFIGAQFLQPDAAAAGRLLRVAEGLRMTHAGTPLTALEVGTAVPQGSRLVTGDEPAAMELGDGLNVRLDKHTRVTVSDAHELVLEEGRIYVDSGVDSPGDAVATSDGLAIETPFGVVRDIGTQFAVELHPERLVVQVRDGLVQVRQPSARMAIMPGQRLHLDGDGEIRSERIALSGDHWQWVEAVAPAIAVEGRTVYAFLATIQRQTGLEIRYATPEVAAKAVETIIGGAHPDLPPRQLLDIVIAATDFQHLVTDSAIVITAD